MTVIDEIEKQIETQAKQKEQKMTEELQEYKQNFKIIRKYQKQKPQTQEELNEILGITCFNNLSYCCSTTKPCWRRDSVLEALRMNKKDLEKLKKKLDQQIKENVLKHENPRKNDK